MFQRNKHPSTSLKFLYSLFIISFLFLGAGCFDPDSLYLDIGENQAVLIGEDVKIYAKMQNTDTIEDWESYDYELEWKEGDTLLSTDDVFSKNDFSIGHHTIIVTAQLYISSFHAISGELLSRSKERTLHDTVIITVNTNDNAHPIALNQHIIINENKPVNITLSGTDADNEDTLTYRIKTQPTKGVISGTLPNITYTPAIDNWGVQVIKFDVYDGTVYSSEGTIGIEINALPIAIAGKDLSTTIGARLKIDASASSDPDGSKSSLIPNWTIVTKPNGSTATTSITGRFKAEFTTDKAGIYVLSFILHDRNGSSVPDEVTIDVLPNLLSWCGPSNDKELWERNINSTSLVTDISPNFSSSPELFTSLNNKIFFSAETLIDGKELWSHAINGTTSLYTNIRAGAQGSNPQNLLTVEGNMFFTADDGINGTELWATNGETQPTLLEINSSGSSYPSELTELNGKIYFKANDGINGIELWQSDGINTSLVKNIAPGDHHSNIHQIIKAGNTLFFKATDETTNNAQLWKSEGTEITTVMVKDMVVPTASINNLTAVDNAVYFSSGIANNYKLWKSEGELSSTIRLLDHMNTEPRSLTNFNGDLFFITSNDLNNVESLWKSDGNNTPVKLVDNIDNASELTVVGDTLFYISNDLNDFEQVLLSRINKGSSSSTLVDTFNHPVANGESIQSLEAINDMLYIKTGFQFGPSDSSRKDKLWLVDEITANSQSSANMISEGCW